MTQRERMLAAIQGRPSDRIPYVPRLDLWYQANRSCGTLPARFRAATLKQITDELGFGYHCVIPDFRDSRVADAQTHRGLGIYNLWTVPYRTEFSEATVLTAREGEETVVEYRTPAGTLRTRFLYTDQMARDGITISHLTEHVFKEARDYPALCHLFRHAAVTPSASGYQELADFVGDSGLAVPFLQPAGSPMHLFLHDLMPAVTFFLELYDHPQEMAACAEAIGAYFRRVFRVAVDCRAEVLLLGSNYDAQMSYPPFFARHITPWLRELADLLHARGKYLLTHADGENRGLLDCYLDGGIDVADSICPAPMTSLTLQQVRRHFAGRLTVMGGIPSVALLPASMSDRDFEAYLDALFETLGKGDHLILGISDTTPPQADFSRILKIAEYVERFGPVRP